MTTTWTAVYEPCNSAAMPAPTLVSSADAAKFCGITVAKFHRRIARGEIAPVLRAPGEKGAMFFRPRDVTRLAKILHAEAAAKAAKAEAAA